ncbi:DCD (Development and Cell Death) domain protein [Striga asiatica]|uniref:DCD (Development and Cell Death) domain protein n=1 Tax=Striga asiatica TaxID=4170 RepID=A0A5A7PN66_STRAF|nr:DCD (Development and Cell Death) domain protein [Striga asiatica]
MNSSYGSVGPTIWRPKNFTFPMYSLTDIFPNFLHASGGGPQQEETTTMVGELLFCIYIDICIAFFIFLISPTSRPGPISVQSRSNRPGRDPYLSRHLWCGIFSGKAGTPRES